jgi:hypothetical protein
MPTFVPYAISQHKQVLCKSVIVLFYHATDTADITDNEMRTDL